MKRISKVQVGQKFRAIGVTGKPTYTYEVQAMFRSNIDEHDYARLVEMIDQTRTKTTAVATLMDPRHFVPLPVDGPPPSPPTGLGEGEIGRAVLNSVR
ncbi:MAG TPA: hypothetical protein VET66_06435 [Steroidobacteraceae bacterium]|nr:hypothetical protein [Steroidobacteraceae bacterium]